MLKGCRETFVRRGNDTLIMITNHRRAPHTSWLACKSSGSPCPALPDIARLFTLHTTPWQAQLTRSMTGTVHHLRAQLGMQAPASAAAPAHA